MYPDKILGFFHMYGLMIGVGVLACFGLLFWYGKKRKLEDNFLDFIFYDAILAILVGFGSAALFQAVYDYIETGVWDINSGITFLGGFIGGAATFLIVYFIFRKKYKNRLLDILSFIPCCILLAHGFGRIGCLFAGCCHGAKTDAWYGIYMHTATYGYAKVVPTQLFEAIFLFALGGVCFFLYWKKNFKHNLSLYLIAYGIFRFCLEFLRADDRGKLFGALSPSQFWSVMMIIIGVALIFILQPLYKKREAELSESNEGKPCCMEKTCNEGNPCDAEKETATDNMDNTDTTDNTEDVK